MHAARHKTSRLGSSRIAGTPELLGTARLERGGEVMTSAMLQRLVAGAEDLPRANTLEAVFIEVAFVAAHHIIRIAFVMLGASLFFAAAGVFDAAADFGDVGQQRHVAPGVQMYGDSPSWVIAPCAA